MRTNDDHNIYIKSGDQRGDCTAIGVHFTGYNATAIKRLFDADRLTDDYAPMDVNVCGTGKNYLF